MFTCKCILISYLISVFILSNTVAEKLLLTAAYCPDDFSSAGAIVEIDPSNGNWTIVSKFKWPSAIFGCAALEDPTVTLDQSTGTLYLYFIDEALLTALSLIDGKVVKSSSPSDPFFTGYENMAWSVKNSLLKGVSATVTQSGLCHDGCFEFGDLTVDGKYTAKQLILFKEIADDSHLYDPSTNTFWIQGGYDLREKRCAPVDSDECLLQIDATSGDLISAKWTNWTIYKYGPSFSDGTILAWLEGFESLCQHPYNDFLFAKVNLANATAIPIACIPKDVTVDMDEWIASFSKDGSLLATSSGNAETGVPQLLILDTTTGVAKVNTNLPGLAKALHGAEGFIFIWSVDWV